MTLRCFTGHFKVKVQKESLWKYKLGKLSDLTLLWEFVLWVTRQRCTMVPALSNRGQSSAFGKSHLKTFSLVPELNLLKIARYIGDLLHD